MPEVNIIRDNAATEVPGVRVLELINQLAAAEGESKAYVLPLMCGTGKSSAISLKIRESIENNEGLLVVTDRIERLNEYLNPGRNQELADYLASHRDDSVLIMTSGNAVEAKRVHHKYPVLLMTTQRYFKLSVEEINSFLEWEHGKRGLVLIDEKPELYKCHKLTVNDLRKLYDTVNNVAKQSEEKQAFLINLSLTMTHAFDTRGVFDENNREENYFFMRNIDLPDIVEPDSDPMTEIKLNEYDSDKQFYDSIRETIDSKPSYKEISSIFDTYNYMRRHRYLVSCRKDTSEVCITRFQSNAEKITDIYATTIILDGTADLSIDYYKMDFIKRKGSREPDRKIPKLHLRLINAEGTSRQNIIEREDIDTFGEYVQAETESGTASFVFSFKDIQQSFEVDEDGELKEDVLKKTYHGNTRGRNELQSIPVLGQIGILFAPPYRYLEPFIHTSLEWEPSYNPDECAQEIRSLMESTEYQIRYYFDVLAEIEQNIFRCPVRSPEYTGEATYYIFYSFDKNQKLLDIIFERFRRYYGADVTYVKKPLLLELLQLLKKDTIAARMLRYLDKLPIGTEFTPKNIQEDEEANLSASQYKKAKENPIVHILLQGFKADASMKKMTKFIKRYDIREIDKRQIAE